MLADLLRQQQRIDEAQTQPTQALTAWRSQPAIYSEQLLLSLRQFSQAGQCDWLEGDWPKASAPALLGVVAEARSHCG